MCGGVWVWVWLSDLCTCNISSQRGATDKFRKLLHSMEEVLSWRRNIVHSTATHVSA